MLQQMEWVPGRPQLRPGTSRLRLRTLLRARRVRTHKRPLLLRQVAKAFSLHLAAGRAMIGSLNLNHKRPVMQAMITQIQRLEHHPKPESVPDEPAIR